MLKAFQPIEIEVEVKDKPVTLTFVGSPSFEAMKFMNGISEGETPQDYLAAMAGDELTAGLIAADELPEPVLMMTALSTKYRLRYLEVTKAFADPKLPTASSDSSPKTPPAGSTT